MSTSSDRLERLGAGVARHLDAHGPELDTARGLRRLRASSSHKSRTRRAAPWLAAAVVPLVALAVWAAITFRTSAPAPLSYVVEHALLRFSDGTTILLAEDARARVVRIDAHGADIALEHGAITAAVNHREGATWLVAAGPFRVRVTGTKFTVSWDADAEVFALAMHEGSVVVSGPVVGEDRPMRAPEEIVVRTRDGLLTMGAPSLPLWGPEAQLPDATPPAPSPSVAGSPASGASAVALHDAAKAPETALETENAAGLLRLAQSARLSGDTALAANAFEALERRFPESVEAATAVFLAGKLHFDAGRHAEAIAGLRRYLARAPGGAFSREARVLLITALHAAGEVAEARALAEAYLAAHPDDAHAPRLRQLLQTEAR